MQSITPQFFDVLIIVVIVAGLIPAFLRIRADLRRPPAPPPPDYQPFNPDDDTQPRDKQT